MPSIALLHGIQSSGTTWRRVQRELELRGWRVRAPTLLGHRGRPSPPHDSAPLTALADDIATQLDGERFDLLVGHSLGALVALQLAIDHPLLFEGLVLEDPPSLGGGLRATDVAGDVAGDAARARQDPAGEVDRVLAANPAWSRLDAEEAVANRAAIDVEAALAMLRAAHWDLPALILACPRPLHLLAATPPGTALTEPDRTTIIGSLAPDAVTVIDSGHSIHRDQPEEWLKAVLAAVTPVQSRRTENEGAPMSGPISEQSSGDDDGAVATVGQLDDPSDGGTTNGLPGLDGDVGSDPEGPDLTTGPEADDIDAGGTGGGPLLDDDLLGGAEH